MSKSPFSGNPPRYWFFVNPLPLKIWFFLWTSKNIKNFSSSTSSYLVRVTKFLVKIIQFHFLVTAEETISVYKLFLSLNILYFMLKLQLREKGHPFSHSWNPPLKIKVLSSSTTFWKFGRTFKPPPAERVALHTIVMFFWYVKVCIFLKCIKYTIHWDKHKF